MYKEKYSKFVNLLRIKEFPRIYFLKEQKPQFIKILRSQLALLGQAGLSFEDAMECIKEDQVYATIRMQEPDMFDYKPIPLTQFMMPTMCSNTLIAKRRTNLDTGNSKNFSLMKRLFSDNPEKTNRMLDILKKRKVYISKPRLKQILDERANKQDDEMVYIDRYNDLVYFDGPSVNLVVSILFAILDFNREAQS
jgi:hypothetical protein